MAQTLSVLAALYEQPTRWQDGSALAKQAGLLPERLRAIISQLAARGLAQVAPPAAAQRSARRLEAIADAADRETGGPHGTSAGQGM